MHKIESIQTGGKNIGTFYCAGQGLNRGPPGSYYSILTTTTRNTCTQQPLAQGNDLRMQTFAFSPLFKKQ